MTKPLPLPPKKYFKNRKWLHKAYPGWPVLISLQALCASIEGAKRYPFSKNWLGGFYIEGILWDWVWNVKGLAETREYLLKRGPGFVKNLFDKHDKAFKRLRKKADEMEKMDLKKLSSKDRLKHFTKLINLMIDQASIGYLADCSLSTGTVDWFAELISRECKEKGLGDKETLDVVDLLTRPVFLSFQSQAHALLLEIANASKKEKDELIEKYIKKFHWVKNNYEEISRPTKNDVLSSVITRSLEDDEAISNKAGGTRDNAATKQKFYKKYKISKKLQDVVRIAELLSQIQDKRKVCVQKVNPLLFEISKIKANELKMPEKEFMALSALELLGVLAGKKPNRLVLKQRRQRALYWYPKEGEQIWTGEELKNFSNDWISDIGDLKELRGVSACAGKATGTARVIMITQDLRDFKKGEIMVANQTTPEFMSYMKKAAAIVTEQGGLTAHAAIFSREFNIPCVIGTGAATKWIKTGDKIEVDAEKGIVRKISIEPK